MRLPPWSPASSLCRASRIRGWCVPPTTGPNLFGACSNSSRKGWTTTCTARKRLSRQAGRPTLQGSEGELECDLHQARRGGFYCPAEEIAVVVAIDGRRPEELCVIEGIEGFEPELQCFGFGQAKILQEREIEIQHPRSVEEPARSVPGSSQGVRTEERGVEIRQPIARIGVKIQRPGCNIG